MSVGISVAEKSSLEHLVKRWLDSRNHVGRTESALLDLLEVIFWISVQFQHTNLDQRVVLLRPYFCYIKDVPLVVLGILLRHNLNTEFPLWIVFGLNGFKQIFDSIISILALKLIGFLSG